MPETKELKPCWHCPGDEVVVEPILSDPYKEYQAVTCPDCDAWGPSMPTPEEAIEAWNTRPTEAALQAEVDRLKEQSKRWEDKAWETLDKRNETIDLLHKATKAKSDLQAKIDALVEAVIPRSCHIEGCPLAVVKQSIAQAGG